MADGAFSSHYASDVDANHGAYADDDVCVGDDCGVDANHGAYADDDVCVGDDCASDVVDEPYCDEGGLPLERLPSLLDISRLPSEMQSIYSYFLLNRM